MHSYPRGTDQAVLEVIFVKRWSILGGIYLRVLGVGVISLPKYFISSLAFFNTPNQGLDSEDKLVFMSRDRE